MLDAEDSERKILGSGTLDRTNRIAISGDPIGQENGEAV